MASTVNNIEGVKEVQTMTRPSGEEIEDFAIRNQLEQANEGMGDMADGLTEISDGLTEASESISNTEMGGGDLQELGTGIDEINSSIDQISMYMAQTGDAAGAAQQLGQVQEGLEHDV